MSWLEFSAYHHVALMDLRFSDMKAWRRSVRGIAVVFLSLGLCLALPLPGVSAEGEKVPPAGAGENAPPAKEEHRPNLSQGSLTAHTLPKVTVYGVADQGPTVPVSTMFGTQFNVVTEEQINLQNSLDFYDALRNVPGVMYQKKNIIGGQTGPSLYMRGRGASHPSPDLNILFDDVPRSGVLFGQALADGIPVYALGGMEIYKYPQPSRFGNGYGMINFIPKRMTEEGKEFKIGLQGGSYGTFAENIGMGAKKDAFDVYAAQSLVQTNGHVKHSAAYQASYYVNGGFQMNENWSLRLMANQVDASTEAPRNPIDRTLPQQRGTGFDTTTTLSTLTLSHDYKEASGYLKGYYNTTKFSLNDDEYGAADSRQTNDLYGFRARDTLWLWKGGEIIAGLDLDKMDLENRQTLKNGGATSVWNFPDITLTSPYLAVSHLFGEKDGFHVVPSTGLRYYSHNVFEDKLAPQAGLVLGYANTDLNFNYARGVNYPSPVVLQGFLRNGNNIPESVNTKKIKPEVVDHYEVGLTHTWPETAKVNAILFRDEGRDRLRANLGAPGYTTASQFNSRHDKYLIEGVELSGSVTPVKALDLFAGATFLRAEARGDDGVTRHNLPYTPSFTFQAGFKWRFLENFQFSGDYQHLSDVYAATSMRAGPPNGSNFSELTRVDKLPDIDVVNLRLDYFLPVQPSWVLREGKIFVAVDNVLDNKYAYAKEVGTGTLAGKTGYYWMPGVSVMAGLELKF